MTLVRAQLGGESQDVISDYVQILRQHVLYDAAC